MNDEPIEAVAIPQTSAVVVRSDRELPTISQLEQQFALAVRQRELLSDYIKKQLLPGKHFYQRGDQKPSLTKEGAEIILLPHRLAPDYELVSGPESPPENNAPYQITVKCTLRVKGDSQSFVGSGIGSAGSEHRNKDGKYTPRQPDKYLCHNATLKMAQKSAMIAATINSTAASEFFTQDMEEAVPQNRTRPVVEPGRAANSTPPSSATQPVSGPPRPATAKIRAFPTDAHRARMIASLKSSPGGPNRDIVTEYFQKLTNPCALLANEEIEDLPLRFVPLTKEQMIALHSRIADFGAGGRAEWAFPPHAEPESPPAEPSKQTPSKQPSSGDEAWRTFPMPFGKNAGVTLEDLEKNYLFGLWANYTVETQYKGKPKKPETIAKDQTFRAMLDLAGAHYQFSKPD